MTGFIIFAIVLTLAYVLYFAAMITTDLAAMKKAAETEEENIDIGTGSEEVDEFATQNVVEDPSTGGFNFVSSQHKEEVANEIAEAEEDDNDDDALRYDNDDLSESEAEHTSENHEQEPEDNEEPAEDLDEPEPEEEPIDEESGGFEVHDFSEPEEEPEQKAFKEDDAFDPSLRQKKYDVKNLYEPTASPEVNGHANTVNAAMEPITTKSVCLTSSGLLSAVRNHTADRYNIDYNHVQTKF